MAHIYFGVKRTAAMTAPQWQTLLNLIETGSPSQDTVNSENRFQTRYNLLGDAAIYEALFDDADITLERIRQRLVSAFGVADARVTVTTSLVRLTTRNSLVGAFRLDGTIYFRATIFGRNADGQGVTWEESRLECVAYLAANAAEWDG